MSFSAAAASSRPRGEPARRDHRNGHRIGECQRRRDVEPLEQPVAVDVGVDDSRDTGILEALRELRRAERRRLRPALHRNLPATRIDANRDLPREGARRALHQLRVVHRHGAEDHALQPPAEPALDAGHVADAAAELHVEPRRRENGVHRRAVLRAAGEGAVEVDHVQPGEAGVGKAFRLVRRVAVEHGGARHVALLEAHRVAVLQVDGGIEDHCTYRLISTRKIQPSVTALMIDRHMPAATK